MERVAILRGQKNSPVTWFMYSREPIGSNAFRKLPVVPVVEPSNWDKPIEVYVEEPPLDRTMEANRVCRTLSYSIALPSNKMCTCTDERQYNTVRVV